MRPVRIGLIGLGVVGSGVVEIFGRHKADFMRRAGVDIELSRFADRNPARAAELALPEGSFTTDAFEIVDDPEIDIIVELIGGTQIAKDVVLRALEAGKSVVTANKALIATHGREIMDTAASCGVDVLFEASVGGGIPIISPLKHCLVSNEISAVVGIVNGTTNYMLSRMADDGLDYASALAEAQERGFAESDPSADVDGHDSAAKIAILASIAFNSRVTFDDVPTEGIRSIRQSDIGYAREMGYTIKLLAMARRTEGAIEARVHPAMIPSTHPLASVNGVYNAIFVVGDSVGEVMFFGEGAGSLPAASAVVGDIIEAARHIGRGCAGLVGCTCAESLPLKEAADLSFSYYVRLRVDDRPGVLAAVAGVFGDHDVSIGSVIQKTADESGAEIVYVTHLASEKAFRDSLAQIMELDCVTKLESVLRVEEL